MLTILVGPKEWQRLLVPKLLAMAVAPIRIMYASSASTGWMLGLRDAAVVFASNELRSRYLNGPDGHRLQRSDIVTTVMEP